MAANDIKKITLDEAKVLKFYQAIGAPARYESEKLQVPSMMVVLASVPYGAYEVIKGEGYELDNDLFTQWNLL